MNLPLLSRLLPILLLLNPAHAINLNLSTAYPSRPRAAIDLSEINLGSGQAAAELSTTALSLRYRQSLSLPPLGNVTGESTLTRPHSGGLRFSSSASGVIGPVALNLGGEAFSAALATADAFSQWDEEAHDLRPMGWNLVLDGRYRLNRNFIAHVRGDLGAERRLLTEVELRRPLGTEDDPTTANLSLRTGAQLGPNSSGLTTGLTYSRDDGLSLGVDALLSRDLGLRAHLDLPPLNETDLSLYAAYEPWRTVTTPIRYGLSASRVLGQGQFNLDLHSGQLPNGETGSGLRVSYALPLGQGAEE